MKKTLRYIGFVICVALAGMVFPSCEKKEPVEKTYDVTFLVLGESSLPLPEARVKVGTIEKQTDENGKCSFFKLKDKWVTAAVSADCYQTSFTTVGLTGEPDETVTITLSKGPLYVSVDTPAIDTKEGKWTQRIQIQSNTDNHASSFA